MTSMIISGKRRPHMWFFVLAIGLTLFAGISAYQTKGYASVPKLDDIRVALFIDSGKGYKRTVPSVTVSAEEGFSVGIRQPDGEQQWLEASGATSRLRLSIDYYRLVWSETEDEAVARGLFAQLDSAGESPYILQREVSGKPLYQIYTGPYASQEAALSAKSRISGLAGAAAQTEPDKAVVAGPLYWSAGTYQTEPEAADRAASLAAKGIVANIAMHVDGGIPVYSVWIGEAADAEQLNRFKAAAVQAFPGLSLQPVDTNEPFLVKRKDVSDSERPIDHYYFNGNGQNVRLTPKNSLFAVAEKSGSTYRGSLEISQYNGSLAVINELPFEQYLYSVVGAEMGQGWPAESLKAQVVAARTYALAMGMKYQIAHISDSTVDQAYKGTSVETESVVSAVDATAGEVLVNEDGLITPLYSSNAGGMTGDPTEVWGRPVAYLKHVPSPDDAAESGRAIWHRIVFADGQTGYIHSDYVTLTNETNAAGFPLVVINGQNINVRLAPYVDNAKNAPIRQVNNGETYVSIEQTVESNAYSWIRGPYSANELLALINAGLDAPISGELRSLEVTERGPSGRVTELTVNGSVVPAQGSDDYRTLLGGLPSTRFEIEETARYTIEGANETVLRSPGEQGDIYVLSGFDVIPQKLSSSAFIAMDGDGRAREITREAKYRFHGTGFGHGLGMSQWGARGLAELGYDYRGILEYYYQGVTVTKE